jgi:hypothetical protein
MVAHARDEGGHGGTATNRPNCRPSFAVRFPIPLPPQPFLDFRIPLDPVRETRDGTKHRRTAQLLHARRVAQRIGHDAIAARDRIGAQRHENILLILDGIGRSRRGLADFIESDRRIRPFVTRRPLLPARLQSARPAAAARHDLAKPPGLANELRDSHMIVPNGALWKD